MRIGTISPTCSLPRVARAVPGAPLMVSEMESAPFWEACGFQQPVFVGKVHRDVGVQIREGIPLEGIFEQEYHKVRIGTISSTCIKKTGWSTCVLQPG